MNDKEFRLECLRLASLAGARTAEGVIEVAGAYAGFVLGAVPATVMEVGGYVSKAALKEGSILGKEQVA